MKHIYIDLKSLKQITCAAAPLGKELQTAVSSRLNCYVVQGWGMTELSPVGTKFKDDLLVSIGGNTNGAVGELVANTDAKIISLETGM